jgi:CheY-like chemotaxis protein
MSTILIADDQAATRRLWRELLEEAGHQVRETADGLQCVRECRRQAPDLVLCDLFMPIQEGLETIQQLRREFPAVKVIAVSGGSPLVGADFLAQARMFGAVRTFAKPVDPDELLRAIREVLAPAPGE